DHSQLHFVPPFVGRSRSVPSEAGDVSRAAGADPSMCSGCRQPQVGVSSVEGNPKLVWIASYLGQEEPTLDARHGRGCELGGIGAWPELAARFHPAEAVS